MEKQELKELFYGQTMKVELPSGFEATIREQNGEDDDILSNPLLTKDLSSITIFLSSLVIETNLPIAKGGKLTPEAAGKLAVNDQAVLMLASRINSLGSELRFTYDWGREQGGEIDYVEELNNYIWPYISEPFPTEGSEQYNEFMCKPYSVNPYQLQEIILKSGKKFSFKPLDIDSQKRLIKLNIEQNTKNAELVIRDLSQYIEENSEWVKVENFKFLTKREMEEIRSYISLLDKPFKGFTELENPQTGQKILFPIMSTNDFFFPGEKEI